MSRLPQPGADNGTWGNVLNDYLSQSLNSDGTLKPSAVSASGAATDSTVVHNTGSETIAGTKTFQASPVLPTPTLGSHATTKTYVDSTVSAGAPDATTTNKGLVQLTGDLAGTATAPTVPGLAGKEPTITAGTTGQYYRGDKTFQTLDKTAVGLANVDNTSDANKPVSTATTTALNLKVDKSTATTKGDILAATAASTITRVGVGTDGQILTADAASAPGVRWAAAPTAPVASVVGQTGIITGAQIAADAALTGTYAPLTSYAHERSWSVLAQQPIIIGHMGSAGIAPEHSPSAHRYSASLGQRILDLDVRILSDGDMGVMHDVTSDRTCTTTGTIATMDAATFRALTINASGLLGSQWVNNEHPETLSDIFDTYGPLDTLFQIEVKSAAGGDVSKLVGHCLRRGIRNRVIISSANLGSLAPAVAAGFRTHFISSSFTASQVAAAGVTGVCVSTTTNIAAAVSAGLEVYAYTFVRRTDLATFRALGAVGFYCEDPAYLATSTRMSKSSDMFATNKQVPGMCSWVNNPPWPVGGGKIGWSGSPNTTALLGWLCPVVETTYTLTFSVYFATAGASSSAGSWVHLGAVDDAIYRNNIASGGYTNGWRIKIDKGGTLTIGKTSSPSTFVTSASGPTSVITDGVTATIAVTVTPTTITAQRTDVASAAINVTDSDYRGGYVHIGQDTLGGGLVSQFASIALT